MASDLILLTGATGFLGYHVLVTALKAGYRVRCAVRSAQGIDRILASNNLKKLGSLSRHLSWVIVPDITIPGAYDEAVSEVHYIIHVASPVEDNPGDKSTSRTADEIFVKPAVAGVIGILQSAATHSSAVRRVVVTSSVVAVLPRQYFLGKIPPDMKPIDAECRLQDPSLPYEPGYAYSASKIASLNASEAWVKKHNPAFDMISILPAWIWGHHSLATTVDQLAKGSNGILLNILTGKESSSPINSAAVSVQATAEAHLLALRPTVPGNQAFIVGQLERLEEANQIVQRYFPDAIKSGIFSSHCRQPTVSIPMEIGKTERVLGLKMEGLEEMVREVAEQYLELL